MKKWTYCPHDLTKSPLDLEKKQSPLGFEGQAAANDRDPVNPPAPLTHTAPSLAVPEACTLEEEMES